MTLIGLYILQQKARDRSIRDPVVFVSTNVMGTLCLIDVARQAWETEDGFFRTKMYVQVSTDEVYGELKDEKGYFYETTPLDPLQPIFGQQGFADLLVQSM